MGRKRMAPRPIEPPAERLGYRPVELARLLGYSRQTLWRRIRAGQIHVNAMGVVTVPELKRLKLLEE